MQHSISEYKEFQEIRHDFFMDTTFFRFWLSLSRNNVKKTPCFLAMLEKTKGFLGNSNRDTDWELSLHGMV